MIALRAVSALGCLFAVACATAQTDLRQPAPLWQPKVEVDSVPMLSPAPPRPLASRTLAMPGVPDESVRARWWWGRGAVELGAGTDWVAQPRLGSYVRPSNPVIGVRTALSDRARLIYEIDPSVSLRDAGAGAADPAAARFAFEFKRATPLGDLRTSLLRVQLSGASALHFKPRSGGLQVSYRARF